MSLSVLLSIKPEFVEKIFNGSKRFEYRKALFKAPDIQRIIIYASSPVQRVVGEFEIDQILSCCPECLWRVTKGHSGISKAFFDDYFDGRDTGFAIQIGKVTRYRNPRPLDQEFGIKHPPQSFAYVNR